MPIPDADLETGRLAMLTRIRASDAIRYGAKTSNLGEIVTAGLAQVSVPAGFGVPFRYYAEHMRRHQLDRKVEALTGDPRWKSDAAWRKAELEGLQAAIRAAPIDARLLDALYKRVKLKLGGVGVWAPPVAPHAYRPSSRATSTPAPPAIQPTGRGRGGVGGCAP